MGSTTAGERPTHIRYYVLLVLCLATVINYMQRNCIGAAATTIKKSPGLESVDLGAAIAAFFATYALFQLPSGWLAQSWGPRRALTLLAIGWSIALGLCALASGTVSLVSGRLLQGAFQAGIFPCCTLAIAAWLPPTRRALASGMLSSCMLIGSAVGAHICSKVLGPLGWRLVFVLYAIPGFIWAAGYWFWFRDRPRDHRAVNAAELRLIETPATQHETGPAQPSAVRVPLSVVFLSLPMWLICISQFFRSGALRFYESWLPAYLELGRECELFRAIELSSWPQYAGVFGGLAGGLLSDWVLQRTGSRRAGRLGVGIISALIGCVFFVAAYLTSDMVTGVLLLSAGAFIAMFSAPISYALTMDVGGRNLGIVFATMNMTGNLGSMSFTWIVPRLNDWSGNWNLTLIVFAGAHVVAAVCWVFINPDGVIGEPKHGAAGSS